MRTIITEKGHYVQPGQYKGQTDIDKVIIHEGAIICDTAFAGCTGITEVNIGEGVKIFMAAFAQCTGIKELNIAEGAIIGKEAFQGCTDITEVNIAKGVTIKDWGFAFCTGITELNIAEGVTICQYVFVYCSAITELNIAEGATLDQAAFEYCTIPLVHLDVNNTDLDDCIQNRPLNTIKRSLSHNAQLIKDKVEKMSTYLQLLKLETTIPVGLVYCYRGQGILSHLRYLSREVKNKIIKILCCFKNHKVKLNNDIVLNHIIAPPNVEIKLYYNSIEPSEDNFAKKEISASHWLT
ncbi:MAG: leucine-rich repeat domain-containing protein [Pseudomonadota bacterium]|nr:leucine-rich repeat domain-containing protein [Pseudomonadota bacterium]